MTEAPAASASADTTKPTVKITSPTTGQRLTTASVTVAGTAADNVKLAGVRYQLNSSTNWAVAQTANGWTNWTASVTMIPGTNLLRVYAVDTANNISLTNSLSFVYVVSAPLTVRIIGTGKVTPNYNGQVLELGKSYTMTAAAGAGFAFTNWTGSLTTNKPALIFVMKTNLSLTANFLDVQKPTVTVTSPTANQRASNSVVTIKGTATDNGQVTQVRYQLNGGSFTTTSGTTNWQATATLVLGTNTIRVFAVDLAGNSSITNTVSLVYKTSGIQEGNTGYYTGTATRTRPSPPQSVNLFAVVGPDGTVFIVSASADGADGGGASGLINAANQLSGYAVGGTMLTGAINSATHQLTGTYTGVEESGTFKLTRATPFTFNNQPAQGTYAGAATQRWGEGVGSSTTVATVVRADGTAVVVAFHQEVSNMDRSSGDVFGFSVTKSGIFDTLTSGGTHVRGVVSDSLVVGNYEDSNNGNNGNNTSGGGTFSLSRLADAGIQKANAGYYTGTFRGTNSDRSLDQGRIDAILAADGQTYVAVGGSGNGDEGTGFKATINAANTLSATVNGAKVTAVLNPTSHQITGTYSGTDDSGSFSGTISLRLATSFTASASAVFVPRIEPAPAESQPLQVGSSSALQMLEATIVNGSFQFTVATEAGKAYKVQASPDLRNWTELMSFIAIDSSRTIVAPLGTDTSPRFFRLVSP